LGGGGHKLDIKVIIIINGYVLYLTLFSAVYTLN
jgi:hypothetical protein